MDDTTPPIDPSSRSGAPLGRAAGPADADTRATIDRLAVKRGLLLGNMSRSDQLATLALAARCLPTGPACTEAAVNAALKAWLAGTGAMLRIDYVELRRALIDAGLWQRDGFGRAYERAHTFVEPTLAAHVEALATDPPEARIEGLRAEAAAERARRKALVA